MSALIKLDDWLVDNCGQPIINLTMQHPALASLLASLGGVVLLMLLSWVNFDITNPAVDFVEFCGLLVQVYVGFSWLRAYPTYRRLIRPGFSNPFRAPLLHIRLMMLIATVALGATSLFSAIHLSDVLFISGLSFYTAGQYFLACTCPLPKVSVRKGFLYGQVPGVG